jgi:uncharacterized protein
MKAVLALIAIYVAAFFIATQGSSQNPVQASTPGPEVTAAIKSQDPGKAADLRALLESVGEKEQLQSLAGESAAQYREKLRATAPRLPADTDRQAAIKSATDNFQKNFDQQHALQQIASIYDQHYTDDEIRGLLDFFNSPLGKKYAAESPKVAKEIAAVRASAAARATHESLLGLDARNTSSSPEKSYGAGNTKSYGSPVKDEVKNVSGRL